MSNKTRYIVFFFAATVLAIAAYFFADGLVYKSAVNYAHSFKADSEFISIQINEKYRQFMKDSRTPKCIFQLISKEENGT